MHQSRKSLAQSVRNQAAQVAADRPHPRHVNNKEEYEYRDVSKKGTPPTYVANYTKGLPHDTETGLVLNPVDYKLFVQGIQSGDPVDFKNTPLGPAKKIEDPLNPGQVILEPHEPGTPTPEAITPTHLDRSGIWKSKFAQEVKPDEDNPDSREIGARVRAWESAGAGNVFDLEGPDAQAVTMPPAPRFDSDELLAEIVEVYSMALLRDLPFRSFPLPDPTKVYDEEIDKECLGLRKPVRDDDDTEPLGCQGDAQPAGGKSYEKAYKLLRSLAWFRAEPSKLPPEERARHRTIEFESDLFRGVTPGERLGPYLSQFLLLGNKSLEAATEGDPARMPSNGFTGYGALGIPQRVRIAEPCKDYMTNWESYLDVQNGADLRGQETYVEATVNGDGHRFIATPRDLATYVHYDALYEAYLNACLFLLTSGAPFDRGIPFLEGDSFDKQQGFAHFGGPHILTLVTEVATRALKAVRYQKFYVHRRLRPEALGGRLDRWIHSDDPLGGPLRPLAPLACPFTKLKWDNRNLTTRVAKHNERNNGEHFSTEASVQAGTDSFLLPMAFPEGSPMHPAYGAGHGTVAGACVTILKAYFDHGWTPSEFLEGGTPIAYEPSADGSKLLKIELDKPLTVEGELNKLAANIAIGRNWAGVHYYSDYIESIRLGEEIAIGLLEEQKLTYPENFTMTVPLFSGGSVRI